MRLGPAAVVATCALGACALGACASGDGLLIDVDEDGGVGVEVRAIDVWVGEPGTAPDRFVRLPRVDDVQPVDGFPFEILIQPDSAPRTVWVGAFGYTDLDAVGGPPVAMGAIAAPIELEPGVLRRIRLRLYRYDGLDADCLFDLGDGSRPPLAIVPPDADPTALDCDDDGATVTDCNDLDPGINPDAVEACDGIDNNCNGSCDDGLDADGDQFSPCEYAACGPPECADGSTPAVDVIGSCDCDDSDPFTNPAGFDESAFCDGADNDCDPATGSEVQGAEVAGNHFDDDCNGTCDIDDDGDLIATGVPVDPLSDGSWATTCDPVRADCDDGDPDVYPNALERCDGIDDDCDPQTFTAEGPCFAPVPGGCELGTRVCGELDGMHWDPVCVAGTGMVIDDAECGEWNAVADAPWPEQAYYDMRSDDERDTCTLRAWRPYEDAIGARINRLCDPAVSPRTHLHGRLRFEDRCRSQLVGGSNRGGYHLALRDRVTTMTGDAVDGCDVDLVVLSVAGNGARDVRLPSVWIAVIQQVRDDNLMVTDTSVLPVEISVEYADASTAFACGPGPYFDCD